jgi:hypothetical protein
LCNVVFIHFISKAVMSKVFISIVLVWMTLLTMTLPIELTLLADVLPITVNKKHTCNVAFIHVISKVIISIMHVRYLSTLLYKQIQ